MQSPTQHIQTPFKCFVHSVTHLNLTSQKYCKYSNKKRNYCVCECSVKRIEQKQNSTVHTVRTKMLINICKSTNNMFDSQCYKKKKRRLAKHLPHLHLKCKCKATTTANKKTHVEICKTKTKRKQKYNFTY